MSSIAEDVVRVTRWASAVTYYGGYAMFLGKPRVLFPVGVQLRERRNPEGRCTLAEYLYADGSKLLFTWNSNTGANVKVMM